MRPIAAFVVCVTVVSPIAAQEPPHFDVASIKPSPAETPPPGTPVGLRITEHQARFSYLSLKDYIGMGFGVRVYQIIAPEWISSARFEITATIPEDQQAKDVTKVTFAQLAGVVERFVDRPVVDQSKKTGRFNITLDLMPEDFQAAMIRSAVNAGVSLPAPALRLLDTASGAAVPDALKTLGISLERRKLPLEVLVIDSVDRMPTDN
jgi:hypothetical protein